MPGQIQFVDFGLVGDIDKVNPALLQHLLAGEYVPVITPLSANDKGEVFNTNADTVAAEIAVALECRETLLPAQSAGAAGRSGAAHRASCPIPPSKASEGMEEPARSAAACDPSSRRCAAPSPAVWPARIW